MGRLLTSLLIVSCFSFLQVFSQRQPCFSEGAVSIRSSTSSSSSNTAGRVEYCFRPSSAGGGLYWAIVCNSTFLLNEAHVACRTKHSAYSAYTALPGAVFSQLDLEYQVQVDCTGYERSLSECTVTELAPSFPSSCLFVSAGVSCNRRKVLNSIILAGSRRDNEGYVMILRSNSWFFLVSSPTYWTNTQAGVVCRQLGYSGGVVATDTSGFSPLPNHTQYQVNYVCSSTAMELSECVNQNTFARSPVHLAASCSLSNSRDGTLVLSGNLLQVAFDGRFGAVCSSGFGSPEANVACRQLGFTSGSYRSLSSSLYASRPRYLSGLDCSGSESSLLSCSYTRPPGTVCSSGAGVSVTCRQAAAQGLSPGAIAGIVVPIVFVVVSILFLLTGCFKRIKVKLNEHKQKLQTWWSNLTICPRRSTASSTTATQLLLQRSWSQPTATTSSSSVAAEPKQPPNPQLSTEAPPTYRDADQFQSVTEQDDPDIEKPPPYIDPMGAAPSAPPPVGGAAFYPPTAPTYPPTYPPVDPAYPPTYPPTDSAYPPPPHGAFAYPSQPPQ